MKRVTQFHYIPSKKMREYRAALLREYHTVRSSGRYRGAKGDERQGTSPGTPP